jgi:hypothetical protein
MFNLTWLDVTNSVYLICTYSWLLEFSDFQLGIKRIIRKGEILWL